MVVYEGRVEDGYGWGWERGLVAFPSIWVVGWWVEPEAWVIVASFGFVGEPTD